jgi:hypothetical protein
MYKYLTTAYSKEMKNGRLRDYNIVPTSSCFGEFFSKRGLAEKKKS